FAGTLRTTGVLASEQEWRTRAIASGARLDDRVVDDATALLHARAAGAFTRFDGNLTAVSGLPDYARGEHTVSPTALESYVRCPHAYFLQRLLRVSPLEQPEEIIQISPADIGTLIHESLDALIGEHAGALPGHGQ